MSNGKGNHLRCVDYRDKHGIVCCGCGYKIRGSNHNEDKHHKQGKHPVKKK